MIIFTYFRSIDELNKWYDDGSYCEIISISFDIKTGTHFVYYKLKGENQNGKES